MHVAVPQLSQESPPIQDAIEHYTPYINYTKLLFKVLKLLQTLFLECKLLDDFINTFPLVFLTSPTLNKKGSLRIP